MPDPTLSLVYATDSAGQTVFTTTLQNPPAAGGPSSVTLEVAGGFITLPLTNNQGTVPVNLHPALATANVPVTAQVAASEQTAPPIRVAHLSLGSETGAPIQAQLVPPAKSGDPYLIAPTHDSILRAYHFGFLGPQPQQVAVTTAAMQDLYTMMSLLVDFGTAVVAPTIQQPTWKAADLTADQKNALAALQSDVIPNLSQTLGTVAPTTGGQSMPFAAAVARGKRWKAALEGYIADKTALPNLADD